MQSGSSVAGQVARQPLMTAITAETISGKGVAVQFNGSGQLRIAMASVSGRMPAVGISLNTALSGTTLAWAQCGSLQYSSGMQNFTGLLGKRLFVGRSGQITTVSGSYSSGGIAVADLLQPVGIVANSGGIYFNVSPNMLLSGGASTAIHGVAFLD